MYNLTPESHSCTYGRSGKGMSMCILIVCVTLAIQHEGACAVLYRHVQPLLLYIIFLRYLINDTVFGKLF
jgi:hypothetical protein